MSDQQMPPIILWPDRGKGSTGPNDLQRLYFIDRLPLEERPHLHTQDVILSIGGKGSGKCFGIDTPILMYDGTIKKVQDVMVGDQVMGPDSKPRNVTSLGRGRETMYKVIPNKGDPFVCNESHILTLRHTGHTLHYKNYIENVTVKDYLKWSLHRKHVYKLYHADTVTFPNSEEGLPIDPYFLGLWLGDGASKRPDITTMDPEVSQFVYEYASKLGLQVGVSIIPNNKANTYRISRGPNEGSDGNNKGCNSLLTNLQNLNLINNKHIPQSYLWASVEDRLQLLAGLVDTDGSYDSKKMQMEFFQKSKEFISQVAFLARSLGFMSNIKPMKSTWYVRGEKRIGINHRLQISGNVSKIPTKIFRKQAHEANTRNSLNTGFKLEKLPEDDFYGFTVDQDHLFLLGDFLVVHNTFGAVTRMIDQARIWPGIQIYLGAFNMKVLQRNVWQPFEEILLDNRDRKKRHPFLSKSFGENSQYAKFANGSTIQCINLKENIKENIGFTAGLIVIDEVHLLPDEEALKLLIGRARGIPPQIRQVILCTNPETTRQGWINSTFDLKIFDNVDTTAGPVQKLVGTPCRCQFCTTCRATFKKDIEWVKDDNDYRCPNCKKTKDFYTWEGQRHWCPGNQQYWRVIKSESHHNQHLPDDYYQGMEDMYDPTFFDIMVRGKTNVDLREDYVYNKFNQERQVLEDPIPLDWSRDVFWGLDFNLQPECSVICQYDAVGDHKAFVAKEELVLFGPTEDNPYGKANAVDVANAFVARYKQDYQGHMVYIFCDPHGWGGQTSRELTRPAQIIRILEANGFFCQLVTDSSPFPLKERIDTMNQVCSDGTLYINPVRGKRGDPAHLILSFAELKWKDKTEKDTLDTSGDSNAKRATRRDRVYCMTHPTDALSYIIYHQFNILQEFAETPSVTVVGKVTIEQEPTGEVKKEFYDAPETTKEHIKDGNIPRESEVSRHNRELAAQVQADKERINNQSLKGLLSDRGMKLW